jgi:hypothetical protein
MSADRDDALAPRLQCVLSFDPPLCTPQHALKQLATQGLGPLLARLDSQEKACLALHLGGHFLDYLARYDEPLLVHLKTLQRAAKLEVLAGLFYGGTTAQLAEQDVRGQVEMAREFWESSLGSPPKGFYCCAGGWSPELPRLLSDTGLAYGFAEDTRLSFCGQGTQQPSLGQIERGGEGLAAFVIASQFSAGLAALSEPQAADWLQQVKAAALLHDQRLITVCLTPSLEQASTLPAVFGALWAAVDADPTAPALTLPEDNFARRQPTVGALQLRAPTQQTLSPAAEVMQRRMLHTSLQLREAIGVMEDEELESSWSDPLATIQRLVFAAQGVESYASVGVGGEPSPLAHREATWTRLVQAEVMLDALVQKGTDWLHTTEVDLDGDLASDVLISTPQQAVWLAPGRGGTLYSLDDRRAARMLLDIDVEAWAGVGPIATGLAGMGIVQFVCAGDTLPEGFLAGSAADRLTGPRRWQVEAAGVDPQGSGDYRLRLQGDLPPPEAGPSLQIRRELICSRQQAACRLSTQLEGGLAGIYGLQIPLRLGSAKPTVRFDGQAAQPPAGHGAALLPQVKQVDLVDPAGQGIELVFDAPVALQWRFDSRTGGVLLLPHLYLAQQTAAHLGVRIQQVG